MSKRTIEEKVEQIFENWGYGTHSDKEVCKRLISELIHKEKCKSVIKTFKKP